jgi:hypothetical protein
VTGTSRDSSGAERALVQIEHFHQEQAHGPSGFMDQDCSGLAFVKKSCSPSILESATVFCPFRRDEPVDESLITRSLDVRVGRQPAVFGAVAC